MSPSKTDSHLSSSFSPSPPIHIPLNSTMFLPRSPLAISTFSTFTLSFLFCVSFSSSVLAQKFRPLPRYYPCYAFTEGQGLYILRGREPGSDPTFMLDLSVSWNTSDPIFKKIAGGPSVSSRACAMTNNGEDLFALTRQVGYIYNVKSDSWTQFDNDEFRFPQLATTDPVTGFIYLPDGGEDFQGRRLTLSLDLRTKTVNKTANEIQIYDGQAGGWNTHLRSLVLSDGSPELQLYTPSKVNKTSTGWNVLKTGPMPIGPAPDWNCGVSMHNGTKMVFIGISILYILDVKKRTWKKGPPGPSVSQSACAATGDQFIVWGGMIGTQEKPSSTTFVFNIKTEKWTTSYTAPLSRSTVTTATLPSQTPNLDDMSSSDTHLVTIIVVVVGILLAIILGLIFIFYRRTRRLNPSGQRNSLEGTSTDSLNIKEHTESSRRRDPSESDPNSDHNNRSKWNMSGLLGRTQQGPFGARELSENPHAPVEDPTANRTLQEGAIGAQLLSQHPHAMVGDGQTQMHSNKAIQGYNRRYGDKEELIDE